MLLAVKYVYKCIGVIIVMLLVGFSFNEKKITDDFQKKDVLKDTLKPALVTKNIKIKEYFQFIDSIVKAFNQNKKYKLTEHIFVRNNLWVIDSLINTDYYKMIEKDSFVYDQKEMIILNEGNKLSFPDSLEVDSIVKMFQKTILDVNVPEFKLRILEDTLCLYEFKVRVGKNKSQYLKMGDRITNLRTKVGSGTIVRHVRNPDYYNPVNGHKYYVTVRDDEKLTRMPQIPWIETEINGVRNGQMIHPTTNPVTLGKPSSNGCIGVSEADAWVIYYYSPIGTKINIRYNLKTEKDTTVLNDIYSYKRKE